MKRALSGVLALATASLAAPSSVVRHGRTLPLDLASRSLNSSSSTAGTKIILDNDWSSAGFIPYLLALNAGWDVLGLIGDTSNSWALQTSLHGLATLEVGNLSSCIPVYKGSDYPLILTPETFQTWEDLHGDLAWQGAFAAENLTYEALGNDPTSGDPERVSRSAFFEGYPNGTLAGNHSAAWMVEQVRKYPGEVLIYSGGALTNVALAVKLDPEFASLTKGLVIMGGYLDVTLLQTSGSTLQADLNSDINLKIDPEGAKAALTADFPKITIVGNAANQVFPTQEYLDEVYEVKNGYTSLFYEHYGTEFPFWDETAMFSVLEPSNVLNSTSFYLDVDIAYNSPYYGNIIGYQEALKPRAQSLQKVDFIYEIDGDKLKAQIKESLQYPKTCADLASF
ncbi:Inosine/uridine-preferring nucleoside hydrolase domain-containing protein [Coniella lustricola]|uniref:Inosine/uridine-preferring nucleoside hydrolase domain-containing protein n=1 Tax=Coniella lustricola TaxID=2025994 RepID=A0A2T3AM46_9PEZI|nr:Inosine/uridine-preferring nucleoside hydrolase domain-containing protein [Coniella lustricola]